MTQNRTPDAPTTAFATTPFDGVTGRKPSADERAPKHVPTLRASLGERFSPPTPRAPHAPPKAVAPRPVVDELPSLLREEPESVPHATAMRESLKTIADTTTETLRGMRRDDVGRAKFMRLNAAVASRLTYLREWIKVENYTNCGEGSNLPHFKAMLAIVDRLQEGGARLTDAEHDAVDRFASMTEHVENTLAASRIKMARRE